MSRLSTIRAYFNEDPDATNAENHELVAARALLGEPDIVLDELRQGMRGDVASRLAPTLRGYSDELARRKAEYDERNRDEKVPPYALRYERFPKGSIERAMILFNLWAMEMTSGCSEACNFCAACAIPVRLKKLDPIPVFQLEGLDDEIFDLVGELTGDPKLQIGAIQKLVYHLATDSGDYLFLRELLEYLAKKGIDHVSLSSVVPAHNQGMIEDIINHLRIKGLIERLQGLDREFNRVRKLLRERFPEYGELSFDEAKGTLGHYPNLLIILNFINFLDMYIQIGQGDSVLADILQRTFGRDHAIPEGVDQSKTVEEIHSDLLECAQKELDQTSMNGQSLESLIFDASYRSRQNTLRLERQVELGRFEADSALSLEEQRSALKSYQEKMEAIAGAVLDEIPEPEFVRKLESTVRIYQLLKELLNTYDPILESFGESTSGFERKENRQAEVVGYIQSLEERLKKYPSELVLRISEIPRRAEFVSGLGLSRVKRLLYGESRLSGSFTSQLAGRSFDPSRPFPVRDDTYRMGVIITPYGLENTVYVKQSIDCTTGLLRVPFYRFLDEPRLASRDTHLVDVLPYIIVFMSKQGTDKNFFFAFDGVSVRKITYDANAHTVISDEILSGFEEVKSLEDVKRLFKFRGKLLPKCETCRDCFGIVPRKPEEIAA